MITVLVTGFRRFEGRKINISSVFARKIVSKLKKYRKYLKLRRAVLPVKDPIRVQACTNCVLDKYSPDIVVMLGETPYHTRVEKVANSTWMDDFTVHRGGDTPALNTTAQRHWLNGDVAQSGNTIGTYSCSLAYYTALAWANRQINTPEIIFVHLNIDEQPQIQDRIVNAVLKSCNL